MISKLHYITQDITGKSHSQLAQEACEAGIDWVQLRIKNKSFDECLSIAKEVQDVCRRFGAKLIINDHILIARKITAEGVHVGKEDMSVAEARKILGENFIIGGSTNTFEDIKKHFNEGADYVGLGPFRFTTTKEKLSPVLGLEGYERIMRECKMRGINIPVIAIGGITANDAEKIIESGVYGVAVSSAITLASDKKEMIEKFNSEMKKKHETT